MTTKKLQKINVIDLFVLGAEAIFLFFIILFVHNHYGRSFEFFLIGFTAFFIIYWRLIQFKNDN